MRAHTFHVLTCSNILLICSNSFWKFAATILNLQQVYFICSKFILFAASLFDFQQGFLICSMSHVGHPKGIEIIFHDASSIKWRPSMARYIVCPYSSAFRGRGLIFLGVCERTVERYISKFLVNGGVKPEPVGRSYGGIGFAPSEELIVLASQSFRTNCHSPFSPTTFFEISVY